jgi:hypothetical protein
MLNTWLVLRQAGYALDQGRLDEALALLAPPAIAGHQRGAELRQQLGVRLVERARQRLAQGDQAGAWHDLAQAGRAGIDPVRLEGYRKEVCDDTGEQLMRLLNQRQPQQVVDRLAALREAGMNCPGLATLEQAAKAWLAAQEMVHKGELGPALARIEAEPWQTFSVLAEYRQQLQSLKERFHAGSTALQEAIEKQQWREVIRLADELLVIAPQDHEIRRARSLAWRELEPPTTVATRPAKALPQRSAPSEPPPDPVPGLPRRVVLWIDGVGGFLVCLAPRVSLGQAATADGQVDIPIFADISRLHGYISRDAEGYLFEALRPTTLRGQPVTRTLLRDQDVLTLGSQCQVQFHQPIAISTTARLTLPSGHRLPMGLDGVLLMAETLLMGNSVDAHIQVPSMVRPVALLRKKDELFVQSTQDFEVDGVAHRGRCSLLLDSTVSGVDWRFTLEPIGSKVLGSRG